MPDALGVATRHAARHEQQTQKGEGHDQDSGPGQEWPRMQSQELQLSHLEEFHREGRVCVA